MNGRQRILDTVRGRPTDRVPIAPFVFNNVLSEAHGGMPQDPIVACASYYRQYGFDLILRNYILGDDTDEVRLSSPHWQVQVQITGNRGVAWEERTTITTPERQMREVRAFRRVTPNSVVDATSECLIKSPADFRQFVKYQPPLGSIDCSMVVRARQAVADDGVCCTWGHGAFNMAERYRGLQNLLMDPYEDEDFYNEMMDYFSARLIAYVRQVAKAGSDVICVEGNMANGSMAGPKLFREFVMPYENKIIDAIHEADCLCMYHNCGDGKALLSVYDEMKMDIYESMTPPPFGDTDLQTALQTIRAPKVLCGNLDQINFLVHATPLQIRERVRQVLELAKLRGSFILATSDYISEGTPPENIHAFAQAGLEFGGY